MNSDNVYYSEEQFLSEVDQKDVIIGRVEKWDAHQRGVLHRGYTAVITYKEGVLLQHRKHPVFDDVFDLSFSSHQLYKGEKLQSDQEAISEGLAREWGISKEETQETVYVDKVYYRAQDTKSTYIEHEIDYIYLVRVNRLPQPNPDFAYGHELIPFSAFKHKIPQLKAPLAPWVSTILAQTDMVQTFFF